MGETLLLFTTSLNRSLSVEPPGGSHRRCRCGASAEDPEALRDRALAVVRGLSDPCRAGIGTPRLDVLLRTVLVLLG